MSEITLKRIADGGASPRLSAVFLHGLGSDPVNAWCYSGGEDDGFFWPRWLAEDMKGRLAVYSLGYPADKMGWKAGWPIEEAAVAVLDRLMKNPNLRKSDAPIVFVCHSLGGIVVKQLIVKARSGSDLNSSKGDFLDRVAGVVFLATPHDGSILATLASTFGWVVTDAMRDLIANSAKLGNLSDDYRDYVAANDGRIRHLIYYENEAVGIGKVVTSGSANPGLAGADRVPIGRNHINISKMADRTDQVYEGVLAFLEDALKPRAPTIREILMAASQIQSRAAQTVGTMVPQLLGDPASESIRADLLSLMKELRRTHSTIVKAISPLRHIPDNEATFAEDFRAANADFRDFYDPYDFVEERTHCHKVGLILMRLEKHDAAIMHSNEWAQLRKNLMALTQVEKDVVEEHYVPFMRRFNDVMVGIELLVKNGQVVQAITQKQVFLNALSSQYDDIKKMLNLMNTTIAEIETSLP